MPAHVQVQFGFADKIGDDGLAGFTLGQGAFEGGPFKPKRLHGLVPGYTLLTAYAQSYNNRSRHNRNLRYHCRSDPKVFAVS